MYGQIAKNAGGEKAKAIRHVVKKRRTIVAKGGFTIEREFALPKAGSARKKERWNTLECAGKGVG